LLPRRIQNAYSALKSCFPLRDGAGNINKVGITVIDVTGQRRLEKFLSELGGNLRDVDTRENFSLARELHNSIEEYHSALALSLDVVFRNHKKSTELAQSIRQLDQRITAMNTFVSSIASRFGIDK
jgi:signal transduction histidine kinase